MTQRPLVISFFLVQPNTLHTCDSHSIEARSPLTFAAYIRLTNEEAPTRFSDQNSSAMQGPQALLKALLPHARTHSKRHLNCPSVHHHDSEHNCPQVQAAFVNKIQCLSVYLLKKS